jgi:nucleotide-binding universal stress UspA family protein
MGERMKVLVAYDGSDCAQAALDDARVAGLPAEAECLVLTVAENWLPPPSSYAMVATNFAAGVAEHVRELQREAEGAAAQLGRHFPQWAVRAETVTGSPARMILETAEAWGADLIFVGSHGRTALGRFFLGSVSNKVATEAHTAVRVARGRLEEDVGRPARLVVGFDGTPGAVAAANAVSRRRWPAGTQARLLSVQLPIPPMAADHMLTQIADWVREERARVRDAAQAARRELEAAGLSVSAVTREGDPKSAICDEAEAWGADSIFVGAQSQSRLDRFLLGSVSAAVAARAHCSVEVVRPPA